MSAREDLIALDDSLRQEVPFSGGIWDLLASIHAIPGLREWISLESASLFPWVGTLSVGGTSQTCVGTLLARKVVSGNVVLRPPWAYVVWAWPSKRLLAMVDISGVFPDPAIDLECLATHPAVAQLEQAVAKGEGIQPPPESVARLYRQVFQELPLLNLGDGTQLSGIKPNPKAALQTDDSSGEQRTPTLSNEIEQEVGIRPAPLRSSVLSNFLTRAREMITASGIEPLLSEWRKLYARLHEPVFSVAVVGEFSRGKSTLVNRLLDLDILPVGELPTTAMLTRVMFGSEPAMWRIQPDSKREKLPLAPESWAQLTADDNGNDPQGVVQIEVPNPWLQQTRVELIDTPGAGDLTGTRATITAESIANCDATLVLINATMPISLTERAFVEEHVFLARIPRVSIVLSRLDQVKEPERESVICHVKEQLRSWAPQAVLWSANDSSVVSVPQSLGAVGPLSIREKIAEWATDKSRNALRHRQLAAQLQDLLNMLLCTLETQKAMATSTEADREKARQDQCRQIEKSRLDWEEVRLNLDKRSLDLENWLEQAVVDAQRSLTENLSHQLSRAPNPREWWKEELPYRLNREIVQLSRTLDQNIQSKIGQDMAWLSGELTRRFSSHTQSQQYHNESQLGPVTITPSADRLSDTKRIQYLTRLGGATVMGLGFVLPPLRLLGPLLGVAGAIVGEVVIHKRTSDQRSDLVRALGENIEAAMRQAVRDMRARIRAFFQQVLADARRQEVLWVEAQKEAMARSSQADAGYVTQLDQAMKRTAGLSLEISKALSRT